jgi:hypothetical protein
MGSRRDTILLVALLAIILALSAVAGSGEESSGFNLSPSTHLATPFGARALHDVLKELKVPAGRRTQPLADGDSIVGPLVILAPLEEVSPAEIVALKAWLKGGGTLLYAAGREDPVADSLGLETVSLSRDSLNAVQEYTWPGRAATARPGALTEGVGMVEGFRRAFDPASPALRAGGGATLLASDGRPVAVSFPVGKGKVVAWSDARPLVNERLKTSRAAVLFARLAAAETAGGRTLWFDEYHHGYHGDGSVTKGLRRFFTRAGLGRALIQLGVAAAGLLLLFGRRFGAPLPPVPARRRSPLEHVDALAGAYRQAGAKKTVRRLLLAGLARRLGRRPPREGAEGELLDRLAAHATAGEAAKALRGEWKKGQATDLVALSREVDRLLEEVRQP